MNCRQAMTHAMEFQRPSAAREEQTMSDHTNCIRLAQAWRDDRPQLAGTGFVVVCNDQSCGWINVIRNPECWAPGCIAVGTNGDLWQAMGGNDYDGAARWERITHTTENDQ